MNSVKFPECNTVYAEGDRDYQTHSFVDNSLRGNKNIVSCYRLTRLERLWVLITGRVWVNIASGDGKLRPMYLSVVKRDVILSRDQARKRNKAISKNQDSKSPDKLKAV